MTDKKAEILKQLEQGKITADQALAMLNRQPNEPDRGPAPPPQPETNQENSQERHQDHYHRAHHSEVEPGWVESMFSWVGETIQDFAEEIHDWDISANISDFMSGTYSSNKMREVFTSNPVMQGLAAVTVVGKNAKVEVQGYDGNCVRMECVYNARRPDTKVYLHEENGRIELVYDEKMIRSMNVLCHVPFTTIGELRIATRNDTLKILDVNCTNLMAANRNASIKANTVTATAVAMETTNDNIKLENVRAYNAILKTTNARIHAEHADISHLKMTTTNAGIKLKDSFFATDSWTGERVIEAETTNAGISIFVPTDAALKLDAKTRSGSVSCQRDLYFTETAKTYLQGESSDYSFAGKKLNVSLKTTNASVKVKDM